MPNYPLPKFHFSVSWDGVTFLFTEVSGLDFTAEVIEYRDGTDRSFTKQKMPGLRKFSNITMKKGTFKGDNTLYNWWNTITWNQVDRKNLTISLLNENHEATVTWKVMNAWPVSVKSTDLKADGNEVAIETIEFAHEGLTVENN